MKELGQILFSQLEQGDKLHFRAEECLLDYWEGPREFDITVASVYRSNNFGPVIKSVEQVPALEERLNYPTLAYHDTWYLDDDWVVTHIESGKPVW